MTESEAASDSESEENEHTGGEHRAEEGIEHLQTAAKEMVAAARSFLDAIEEVVSDERSISAAMATVTDLVGAAGETLTHLGDRITKDRSVSGANDGPPGTSRIKKVTLD